MNDPANTNIEQIADLILANKENAIELDVTFREMATQKEETDEHLAELKVTNEENELALIIANKKLDFQHKESDKHTEELFSAYSDLKELEEKIAIQREEKDKRAAELIIANKELLFQKEEKENRAAELLIANKELIYQNQEKENRAAELIIANKELIYQNQEKEKRAAEFILANKVFIQSEENFRRSISESPLGIRIISVEGETIYVNNALLEIYELSSLEEFRNIPAIDRYTAESYKEHIERKEKIKKGHRISDYEFDILRKSGEIRHVKAWRKEVLWNGTKHYQVISLDITEQKRMEEALYSTQQELRKFAIHLQNIREEEKTGLAREIHDDLGQILVALKIDLGLFKKKISKGIENIPAEEIQVKFDQLSFLVDNTIKTTRRIMTGLRPEIIDLLGFMEAAKSYAHEFEERHHIPCRFTSSVPEITLNTEQSVALFRIMQEALTNIAKHAQASIIKIQLNNQDDKFVMEIIDNGIGFDKNHTVRKDSYGMIGMKERVLLLDGELRITGETGKGTTVRVEMPYVGS